MRQDDILPLPSPGTLQRYMNKMKPAYGFQRPVLYMLTTTTAEMPYDESMVRNYSWYDL